jgi:phosphoribosylglycinamide formyltransferase-1
MAMFKIAVLASGRGSNLQAILKAIEENRLQAQVVCVISDKQAAPALEHALQKNIPAIWVNPHLADGKAGFEQRLLDTVLKYEPDCVVLAGYMRILGSSFIQAMNQLSKPIINIHPALLPSFPGLHAQAQAVDYGVRYSGCTVHFVDEGVDTGPIIAQAVVPVEPEDDAEALAARILVQEHQLYPEVLSLLAQGRIRRQGRKVVVSK